MTPKKRAPLKSPSLSLSSESTGTWTWEARAKKLTETNRKNFTHAHFNQIWAPRYNTTKTHWILPGVKFCNIWTNLDAPYSCTPQKRVTLCVTFLACSEWFDLEQFKVILTCILLTDPSTEVINAGGAKKKQAYRYKNILDGGGVILFIQLVWVVRKPKGPWCWAQDLFDVPAMLKWIKFFGEHETVHK